jgi:hypothetical protein
MAGKSTYRWIALLAAFLALIAGMALTFMGETPTLRSLGMGIFVVGGVVYVAARIAMIRKDR